MWSDRIYAELELICLYHDTALIPEIILWSYNRDRVLNLMQ